MAFIQGSDSGVSSIEQTITGLEVGTRVYLQFPSESNPGIQRR